mgnify:CR=1 FL=1
MSEYQQLAKLIEQGLRPGTVLAEWTCPHCNLEMRLMLRAELRHDGLYHIRLSAEGYLYSEEEFSHWCPITPPKEEE